MMEKNAASSVPIKGKWHETRFKRSEKLGDTKRELAISISDSPISFKELCKSGREIHKYPE